MKKRKRKIKIKTETETKEKKKIIFSFMIHKPVAVFKKASSFSRCHVWLRLVVMAHRHVLYVRVQFKVLNRDQQ